MRPDSSPARNICALQSDSLRIRTLQWYCLFQETVAQYLCILPAFLGAFSSCCTLFCFPFLSGVSPSLFAGETLYQRDGCLHIDTTHSSKVLHSLAMHYSCPKQSKKESIKIKISEFYAFFDCGFEMVWIGHSNQQIKRRKGWLIDFPWRKTQEAHLFLCLLP